MKDSRFEPDTNSRRDLERDPSRALRLSVVVPAFGATDDLRHCIAALEASDLPRDAWELIVIDDTEARGPAYARNRGAEKAQSDVIAFVDSDVMVHADALKLMLTHIEMNHSDAVFGAYDRTPSAVGIVSQYRNLLHHFVHTRAAGEVETFWAGCGAISKAAFAAAGGFDEERFKRPEIEDVELGYRLRDAGRRILLDAAVQCTHRKRWTLTGMIKSDFTRRGLPWTRLLADRGMLTSPRGLSLGASEKIGALLGLMFAISLLVAIILGSSTALYLSALSLAGFAAANAGFFGFLAQERGALFTVAAIPLHLIYSLVATSALIVGTLSHPLVSRSEQARYTRRR